MTGYWVSELSEKLEVVDLAKGPIIVKALQRKHKRVEKEFVPIKDVVDSFTDERGKSSREQEKWELLGNKAREGSKRLEDAVGMQRLVMK